MDARLQQLLLEILDSGSSPEVVTSDCPELLPEILAQLRRIRAVEEQVAALFPEAGVSPAPNRESLPTTDELPQIPGYEIESVLGRGGMGVVYEGRHLMLNRRVAIKMLRAGAFATKTELERFKREAEAAARVQHPNMVHVYDVGDHEGQPYFTMEFVEGGTLADQLSGAPQPPEKAADLLETLTHAVHAAHEKGIVYRDLKPSNILLTADGTPKINDFGLASRLEGAAGLTMTGAPIGTPSYMSPEQARGDSSARGPSVDIYALGSLLYELLTGRPPFRAASSSATLQQVISQEPVPPKRLNANVPRDLETICLKCLQKEPGGRYASAADLRDDLRRFLKNEPIVARPIGLPERLLKWTRRYPTAATLLLTALGLVFITILFAMKEVALASERRMERSAWQERLQFVHQLENEGRFREARILLGSVPGGGSEALRNEIASATKDLELVEKLEEIRLSRGTFTPNEGFAFDDANRQYETAFRDTGLGTRDERPEIVAQRLNASAIRGALIAALDDWAFCAPEESRSWILSVARISDPDAWRDRVRDQDQWNNLDELRSLMEKVEISEQPVTLLVNLAERRRRLRENPTEFLQKVYDVYPSDFWLNLQLGMVFQITDDSTAIGYFRAAVALRPDSPWAHYYLGGNLSELGKVDDAIRHLKRVVELDPNHEWAHIHLSDVLLKKGRLEESLTHIQRADELGPGWLKLTTQRREILMRLGRVEEAKENWLKSLNSDVSTYMECEGYAELCLLLGRDDEYRGVCSRLLSRFSSTTDPRECELLGRSCLLAPSSAEQLQQGIALIDRALAADKATYPQWLYPYFRFAKGLAEYRSGHYEGAIAICEGEAAAILGPAPEFLTALAQHRLGNADAAQQALARANKEFDGKGDPLSNRDHWLSYILHREAFAQIAPTKK